MNVKRNYAPEAQKVQKVYNNVFKISFLLSVLLFIVCRSYVTGSGKIGQLGGGGGGVNKNLNFL